MTCVQWEQRRLCVFSQSDGLRPSDSPTRALARRFDGALRSRDSLRSARSHLGVSVRVIGQLLDCRSIDLSCVRFIAAFQVNAVIGTLGHSARRKPLQFATDSLLPANDAQACGWLAGPDHGDLNACNANRGGTREGSRIRVTV